MVGVADDAVVVEVMVEGFAFSELGEGGVEGGSCWERGDLFEDGVEDVVREEVGIEDWGGHLYKERRFSIWSLPLAVRPVRVKLRSESCQSWRAIQRVCGMLWYSGRRASLSRKFFLISSKSPMNSNHGPGFMQRPTAQVLPVVESK